MSMYVENGYLESGYLEGGLSIGYGKKKIETVIIGDDSEDIGAITGLIKSLSDDEVRIVVSPKTGLSYFVNNSGYAKIGASTNNSITKDDLLPLLPMLAEQLIPKLAEQLKINVTMTAPDGTIIAAPTCEHNGSTFTYIVPEIVAGAEYNVVLEIGAGA